MEHSYEELRTIVLEIISGREKVSYPAEQFQHLVLGVAEVLERREGKEQPDRQQRRLSSTDSESVREIFWDLFLQRIITLGINDSNREYPFFKVSSQGKRILDNQNPYIFHDVSTYTSLIQTNVPSINATTLLYLQESMQSYRSGCLLAATVMLGVASEHSFLLLVEAAESNATYCQNFETVSKQRTILQKFKKFRAVLEQHVQSAIPPALKEDLDVQFDGILSVIRTFRNDAGHPSGKIMGREQVYVLLQMFIPYCKKLYGLIDFFQTT